MCVCVLNGYTRRAGVMLLYILHLQLPLPLGYKMDLNEKKGELWGGRRRGGGGRGRGGGRGGVGGLPFV